MAWPGVEPATSWLDARRLPLCTSMPCLCCMAPALIVQQCLCRIWWSDGCNGTTWSSGHTWRHRPIGPSRTGWRSGWRRSSGWERQRRCRWSAWSRRSNWSTGPEWICWNCWCNRSYWIFWSIRSVCMLLSVLCGVSVDDMWVIMSVWRIRRKIIRTVQLCFVLQLCTVICTHLWAVLTVNCLFRRFGFAFCIFFVCFSNTILFVCCLLLLC